MLSQANRETQVSAKHRWSQVEVNWHQACPIEAFNKGISWAVDLHGRQLRLAQRQRESEGSGELIAASAASRAAPTAPDMLPPAPPAKENAFEAFKQSVREELEAVEESAAWYSSKLGDRILVDETTSTVSRPAGDGWGTQLVER